MNPDFKPICASIAHATIILQLEEENILICEETKTHLLPKWVAIRICIIYDLASIN